MSDNGKGRGRKLRYETNRRGGVEVRQLLLVGGTVLAAESIEDYILYEYRKGCHRMSMKVLIEIKCW